MLGDFKLIIEKQHFGMFVTMSEYITFGCYMLELLQRKILRKWKNYI